MSRFVPLLGWTHYGSAPWQTKPVLKRNDMLHPVGNGFVCGKLGAAKSGAAYVPSKEISHVMIGAPTRAGKGVGFIISNISARFFNRISP